MRILLYYSQSDSYKDADRALRLEGHEVSLRWADGFKEAHLDRCDQVYINYDVSAKFRERLVNFWNGRKGKDVFLIPDPEAEHGFEEAEQAAAEAEALADKEAAEAAEAQAKADKEKAEAEEAQAKADKEASEAEAAKKKAAEAKAAKAEAAKKTTSKKSATNKPKAGDVKKDETAKTPVETPKTEETADDKPVEGDAQDDEGETLDEPATVAEYQAALTEIGAEYPANADLSTLKEIYDAIPYEDELPDESK